MRKHYCNDGCGSRVDRAGDRCQPCIDRMKKKVARAVNALKVAGYTFQVCYHSGPESFATAYLKVPGKSFKEAMLRAKKARRELDYYSQLGIAGVDIKLGSIFYEDEPKRKG